MGKRMRTAVKKKPSIHSRKKSKEKGSKKNARKNLYASMHTARAEAVHIREKGVKAVQEKRAVCMISNGSCVSGLGNIGPLAVLPILEKKAAILEDSTKIHTIPLAVDLKAPEELLFLCKTLSPTCHAILLEGIASDTAAKVIDSAREDLSIPVLDACQHGSAIAVLSCLINAHSVAKKQMKSSRIAILGTSPLSLAVTKLLIVYGVGDIVVVDRFGILHPLRTNINGEKEYIAAATNREQRLGGTLEAVTGADAVISVSRSGPLKSEYIKMMAQNPILIALREPEPELSPREAYKSGAFIVATACEEYQNYVSDMLVLPHLLNAVISKHKNSVSLDNAVHIAEALARTLAKPQRDKILPTIYDRRLSKNILESF